MYYRVSNLSTPNEPNHYSSCPPGNDIPGEYINFDRAWKHFLWEANQGLGKPGICLFANHTNQLLAFSFERKGWPKEGDVFDRMRVRVTGAMPKEMKLKLLQEVRSGKRHMREF